MQLDAPRFFALANRLAAYKGVMRLIVESEAERSQGGAQPGSHAGLEQLPTQRQDVHESALFAQLGPGWVETDTE